MRSRAAENGLIDTSTGLLNRSGLLERGGAMLAACRAQGRPASMVLLDCSDLIEVRSIYGNRISRILMSRVVRDLRTIAGEHGLAFRSGAAEFTLLMPGMNRARALQAVHKVLGRTPRVEMDTGDDEIVMVPDLAVQEDEDESSTIGQMHEKLRAYLDSLHELEMRRQQYLTRERERHSRPMGLVLLPDLPARIPGALSIPRP